MGNDLNIVLQFQFKPRTKFSEIEGKGLANYVIQDIAFKAGERQRLNLSKNLRRDFAPIVERELSKMARQVATLALGLSGSTNAPTGSLKIDGQISKAMRANSSPMNISSVTGAWKERSKAYLKWKTKTYKTRKWFKNTGQLQSELKNTAAYHQAYGPMGVKFIPARGTQPTLSSLGRSRGRLSNFIVTGRLEVTVFRRLGLNDLPKIGEQATYSKKRLSGFADSIEKKLTGPDPKKAYRPIVEPFLTYYMNRRIPNAIFRKVEQSVLG
jgi:hypothetical protein